MHRSGTAGALGARRTPKASLQNAPNIPAAEKPGTPTEKVVGNLKDSQWVNLAKREDEYEFVSTLIDEICNTAWDIIFAKYIKRQIYSFAVLEARSWIMELLYRNYLIMDEGETDLKNDQSWKFDEEPQTTPLDSWSEGMVPIKHVPEPDKRLSSPDLNSEQAATADLGDRDRGDSLCSKESSFKKKGRGSESQRSSKPKPSERKVCPLPVELQQQIEVESLPLLAGHSQLPASNQCTEVNNVCSSDTANEPSSAQILPTENQPPQDDTEQEQLPETDLLSDSEQQSYSFTEAESMTITPKESGQFDEAQEKAEISEFAYDSVEPRMCTTESGIYRLCTLIDIPPLRSRRHSTDSYKGRRSIQMEFDDEIRSDDLQESVDKIRTTSLPSTLLPSEDMSPRLTKSYPFIS